MKFFVFYFLLLFFSISFFSFTDVYSQEKKIDKNLVIKKRVKIPNSLENQLFYSPQDPSFLYENKYIPDIKNKGEFLSLKLKEEVINENINDLENKKAKFAIKLPSFKQALLFGIIILIFTLYRIRIRKSHRK